MGRNASVSAAQNGGQTITNTVLPAGEPIQRGDLVLLGQDNLAYAAAMPNASVMELVLRPTAGGPAVENYQLSTNVLATVSATGAGEERVEFCKLKNGNTLVVWQDTTVNITKFAIVNQESEVVKTAALAGATMSANSENHAIALANGGFAIGAITAAMTAGVTVYDAAGNVTTPQFVTDATANCTHIYLAQLVNGNIVTITRQNGSMIRYAIHTSAGAVVKANANVVTPSAASPGDRTMGVAALAGGGFVVAYCSGTSSSANFYAQRFDAAGNPLGSPILVFSFGSNTTGFVFVAGLTGGGFAVAISSSGLGLYFGIYDASGAVQGTVMNLGRLSNETYGNQVALVAAPNGDVGICYNGSGVTVARYAANGALVASRALAASESTTSANMIFHADGSATVTSSLTSAVKLYLLTAALVPSFQTSMALTNMASFPRLWGSIAVSAKTDLPCYQIIVQSGGSGNAVTAYTYLTRRQPMVLVGVANYAAAANGQVSVQLTGLASLRKPFLQPWSVNLQGGNPAGQRMAAIGNTATLHGLFSSNPAAIN